jgi:hypothetical protein
MNSGPVTSLGSHKPRFSDSKHLPLHNSASPISNTGLAFDGRAVQDTNIPQIKTFNQKTLISINMLTRTYSMVLSKLSGQFSANDLSSLIPQPSSL